MIHDIQESWEDYSEGRFIAGSLDVSVYGVEEPEGSISGIVSSLGGSFGEEVGYEPVFYIMGEGSENPSGLVETARRQSEAFQAYHGIATPIGEPVVAGYDRHDLITRRVGPGGAPQPSRRGYDELISCQYQLCSRTLLNLRPSSGQKPSSALLLQCQGVLRASRRR